MDVTETKALCTKHRLWKRRVLVMSIVDLMLSRGYEFKDLVFGEPNNFVFADHYEEIDETLRKKGGFYGIRLKFQRQNSQLEINSNTDGVNNVQYTIFAETEDALETIRNDLVSVRELIHPSSESIAKASEYIGKKRKLRNAIIIVLAGIILYVLGAHVFLFDVLGWIFSFSPFLLFILVYYVFFRRRY